MINKKWYFFGFSIFLLTFIYLYSADIKKSSHNLSTGGTGTMKASNTSEICIFCHTNHNIRGSAPMWSRASGIPLYTLYTSSTLNSIPGQPDGASKLCLSCHDGTIALGKISNSRQEFNMTNTNVGKIPTGTRSNLSNDLSDDHPISFDSSEAVNASSELTHPPLKDPVQYGKNNKIQCTSCHNPHQDTFQHFLVKNNVNSMICKTCHALVGYNGISTHDISVGIWSGTGQNPWPHTSYKNVAANSCQNCHNTHQAGGKYRLLSSDIEEEVCLTCHDGNVGANIDIALNKSSTHRVNFYQGIHDPAENILTASTHVECVDCHNPHKLNKNPATAPHVKGRLNGVSGMNISGSLILNAQYEYEVCLKCHGQDKYNITTPINRMFSYSNLREALLPSNVSYHAVTAQGKAYSVPSLIPPYTTSSRLYCTDCHNSNSGAKGPHGSSWDFLLERRYEISDYTNYSEAYYALCFKCHDPNRLMNKNVSTFNGHFKHVREEDTPCSVCHDPHGSNNSYLINFDLNVVSPDSSGRLRFEIIGDQGYCYLSCHGKNHQPGDYRRN